jgi:hypothetical protein
MQDMQNKTTIFEIYVNLTKSVDHEKEDTTSL